MIQDGSKDTASVHSFLMIGQSNMAGRGTVGDVPPIENPHCLMLRMGRWQAMSEPVNPDRALSGIRYPSGISLAASFADEYARAHGVKTGLIPCADGGTRILQWMEGEILYDHAVMMAQLAMRTSTLRGILWHQGESDCNSDEALAAWGDRFVTMMTALRRDLGAEDLPLVIGELSTLTDPSFGMEDRPRRFNLALPAIAARLPRCGVASAEGLTLKPDGLHFDAPSCRELGRRYYAVYRALSAQEK